MPGTGNFYIRRISILLLLVLSVGFTACGQAPEKGTAVLWEVTKKHSDTKVYLLGSLAYASEKLYPLDSKIEKYFEDSKYLMVECDVSKYDTRELQNLDVKYAAYKNGETFQSKVAPELYKAVEKEITAYNLDMKALNKFKPWYFASILSQLRLVRGGYRLDNGLDFHFMNRARGYKEILEMESLDDRLKVYSSISEDLQLEFLKECMGNSPRLVDDAELLTELWKRADIPGLVTYYADHATRSAPLKQFEHKIYASQNTKLLERIDSLFKTGKDCFAVVDPGRLIGTDSILPSLEKKGFKIRQR